MAVSLKHSKTSAKADGADTGLVQPSDWNAEHVLTQATNRLLGRTTAGVGATEEISVSSGLTFSALSLSANVTSVAGRTGAVTLAVADVSGAAPLASPTFTGVPAAPTAVADTNTTQVATTAYVVGQAGSTTPTANGTAAVGTSLKFARADHVHPTDTTRAPLASPTFTGVPAAPTAAVDTNTTQLATTAYVVGQGYLKSATASSTYAPLASPTFTGTATFAATSFGGNITITGTGRRITGDFSNATVASRTLFQDSTANTLTSVGVIPNGTATDSFVQVFNNSDPTNAGVFSVQASSTVGALSMGRTGTGTFLPMMFAVGGSERVRIDTNGNVGFGVSDPATYGNFAIYAGSGATTRQTIITANNNLYNGMLSFLRVGTTVWNVGVDQSDSNKFKIANSGSYSLSTGTSMTVDTSGNVGIATASPASKFDVNGGFAQNVVAVAASAIDCSLGNVFTKTATGALTWTFTNVPASRTFTVILELTNGGTGTQTWPAAVKWPGGTAPTLVASGVDVLGFITDDGGTTWRGVQLMKDSK